MKIKIVRSVLALALPLVLFTACNSQKDVERTPEDHETVMNTTSTSTTPLGHDTMRNDSVRFPPPTNPDSTHYPPNPPQK